jgi:hypothetical protein
VTVVASLRARRGRCYDLRRRDGRDRRSDGYTGAAAGHGHRSQRGSLGVEMKAIPVSPETSAFALIVLQRIVGLPIVHSSSKLRSLERTVGFLK